MKLRITHETHYNYTPAVETAQHVAHLQAPTTPCQLCLQHDLFIEPKAAIVSNNLDSFGNHRLYFSLPSPHSTLTVRAESEVQTFVLEDQRMAALSHFSQSLSWESATSAYQYRAVMSSDYLRMAHTMHPSTWLLLFMHKAVLHRGEIWWRRLDI